jgi:hypothetical protein
MTLEDENTALKVENLELMAKLRKHREMGQESEAEARDLRLRLKRISDSLLDVIHIDDPRCRLCLKAVAQVALGTDPPTRE